MQKQRGEGYWHFNNSILTDPIFEEEINAFWTQWLTEKSNFDNPLIWWDRAKLNFTRIAIKRSTMLRKIQRNDCAQLEQNLEHLQQKAMTGTAADQENYLTKKTT